MRKCALLVDLNTSDQLFHLAPSPWVLYTKQKVEKKRSFAIVHEDLIFDKKYTLCFFAQMVLFAETQNEYQEVPLKNPGLADNECCGICFHTKSTLEI